MTRNTVAIVLTIAIFSSFAATGDDAMPSVAWGEAAADVIDKPYLCRGPLAVGDGIDVHICTMSVLNRETLVNFFFVDGLYACFVVMMESSVLDCDLRLRDFDGLRVRIVQVQA